MCDPFNTSIEAALWDECHDLDPFMAEHYATNAQHEIDRLAVSQPFSVCIAHVRRLHAEYNALAATAQLPEDSDFDEADSAERVERERMTFVHPDRLALMSSGREDTASSSSRSQGRSSARVSANVNNSVVPRNSRTRPRSRDSSVESIVREDGFDHRVDGHHDHVDHNQELQQWAAPPPPFFPPPQAVFQAMAGFLPPPGQHGGNNYHYAPVYTPVVVNNYYYGFAPPQHPQYGSDGDAGQGGPSGGSDVGRGRRGRGRGRRGGRAGN